MWVKTWNPKLESIFAFQNQSFHFSWTFSYGELHKDFRMFGLTISSQITKIVTLHITYHCSGHNNTFLYIGNKQQVRINSLNWCFWFPWFMLWGHSFCTSAKFSQSLTFLTPWYVTYVCVSGGQNNFRFSEDFAYVLHEWSSMILQFQ